MDIHTLTESAAEMLRGMVAIPSESFHEEKVCSYISETLEARGIRHTRIKNNIIAANLCPAPSAPTLMLCAHMDTVPVCDGYDIDPYNPDREQVGEIFGCEPSEIVCGLGSNDDGGSVVSLCAAFQYYYGEKLPVNLVLVLSSEEERSGPDGMSLVWEHFSEIPGLENVQKPEWAIVGEPTEMKAATSERGLLVIDGTAEGVSGHAARGEGVNAIYIALEDIRRLREYEFSRISPRMGKVRLSVTQIDAGTAHNVIPDKCRFVVDIRPTEMYSNAEILENLRKICQSSLAARNLKNRSSATRDDSPLLDSISAAGIGTFSSPTTSDWIRIGCDAVKIGPGKSERSHKKNEFITKKEISDGINGYIAILKHFFDNRKFDYGDTLEQRH